jgi:hypothetical protein
MKNFRHEGKKDQTQFMEKLFQHNGVLYVQIQAGGNKLHKIKKLQVVTVLRDDIEYNSQEQSHSHRQGYVTANHVSGVLPIVSIIVEKVNNFFVIVDADGLIGRLRVQVGDCDVGCDEVNFLEFVNELKFVLCEFVLFESKVSNHVVLIGKRYVNVADGF